MASTSRALASVPANFCVHLQNASRAFQARTSVPYTNASLAISTILLRTGLISNITTGSPAGPSPNLFPTLPPPARKLWLGLKHRNGLPVLRRVDIVSKASLRVSVSRDELGRILMGKRAKNVTGAGMGEIFVVNTGKKEVGVKGYMEGWEAWRAGHGGEVVCRCS
ncbi:hypothetical protein IAT38_005651 [Cryptococcus sp. DSM 104549]